jgi:AraC family ethanolamine operon transcriptional activator
MNSSPQFHKEKRSDVADYQTLLVGPWELEYRQLSAGSFRASNIGFTLGDSVVYEETFNRSVSVYGALRPGLLGFSVPNGVARRRGKWWGAKYTTCAITFATGDGEIDVAFTGGYRNFLILLPEEAFRAYYLDATGEDAVFLDHGFPHLPMDPACYSRCFARLRKLISMPAGWNPPQDFVVSTMVETLSRGMQPTAGPSYRTAPRLRSRVVREAIELWRDSHFELSIRELSHLVVVSQRTLEHAFRDRFDLSPYQYLKRCRLGLVREALRQADPDCSTVTDVAIRYGFYELGRFAGEYRRFFGEQPSETLSRRSGPRPSPLFPK